MNENLNREIVKGLVADYAKRCAIINSIEEEELALILRQIADLLDGIELIRKD